MMVERLTMHGCCQVQADVALMHEINELDKMKLAQERERQEMSLRDTAQLAGTDFPPNTPEDIPPIKILCATWNLGEAPCTELSLCAWLPPREFDIYVVAAQHLGQQKERCVVTPLMLRMRLHQISRAKFPAHMGSWCGVVHFERKHI
jgi:hypothetical protein